MAQESRLSRVRSWKKTSLRDRRNQKAGVCASQPFPLTPFPLTLSPVRIVKKNILGFDVRRHVPYPHPSHPDTFPARRRKPVTIASGFKCPDGIVLATDTEYTTAYAKTYAPKLFTCAPQQDFIVCLAGAGDADYMKMAAERIDEALPGTKPTFDSIRYAIETANTSIYKKHVYPYPGKSDEKPWYDLMAAVWVRDNTPPTERLLGEGKETTRLFKLTRTSITKVDSYSFLGTGEYLANYLARLHWSFGLTLKEAEALAVYVIKRVKTHVPYCGGDTKIATLSSSGVLERPPATQVSLGESYFSDFEEIISNMMVNSIQEYADEEIIKSLADGLTETILRYKADFQKAEEQRKKLKKRMDELRHKQNPNT